MPETKDDKTTATTATLVEAIDAALSAFAKDCSLSDVGAPLMRAVETALPDSQAALFEVEDDQPPALLAAPSLSAEESARVGAVLAEAIRPDADAQGRKHFATGTPIGEESDAKLLLFEPVVVSDHNVVGYLALLSPRDAGRQSDESAEHLRRISRIAGLMIEDRIRLTELRESETLLARLIDTSPDAIIRIGADENIVGFSAAAETMFGYAAEEVLGKNVAALMTSEHGGRHAGYIARYMRTGERRLPDFGRRLEAKRKDGSVFPVEIALAEFEDHGALQFVGIVRDISYRVEVERRVDELRDALAHAAQLSLLGEMAATVAHEVNQPLTAAASYLDAANMELERVSGEEVDKARALIAKAAGQNRLGGEIVRRLRRLTEQRKPMFERESLNDIVSEATAFLADVARGQKVRFEQRYADDLPPINADRVQLQQVVSNLIRNALEAVKDSPTKRVTLETRATANAVEIEVWDTGPGVPEDMRASIFDSFVTGREDGIGLGLAISRSIVEEHGGRMWVEDHESGGASFRVRLPKADDGAIDETAERVSKND